MATQTAFAVIGAGFGDEGKGLMVDALARRLGPETIVVRSNGGAQAGHTVVTPEGRRHVFHHVGSGTLAGARTHLSRFFVHNPIRFGEEMAALGSAPAGLTSDPCAPVTTPWDMMVNQIAETARGGGRHGSCGLGFGETIARHEGGDHALAFADLADPRLADRLRSIRDMWFPARLAELGLTLPSDFAALVGHDGLFEAFLEDCATLRRAIQPLDDACIGASGDPIVFEGAQGLRLCMELGAMPHVTRSVTGLRNMALLAREAGLRRIEAHYVTRCYLTRHGAGPLPSEGESMEAFAIDDPTNVEGPWQGRFRTAPLDLDALARFIAADRTQADLSGLEVGSSLAVTCLDQIRDHAPLVIEGKLAKAPADAVAAQIARGAGLPLAATSHGPSAYHLGWCATPRRAAA